MHGTYLAALIVMSRPRAPAEPTVDESEIGFRLADSRGDPQGPVGMAMRIRVDLESSFFFAYGADPNRGGIFIETEDVFEPGTPLELEFTLPSQPAGDQPIRARGVVAWATPCPAVYLSRRGIGMGIEFTEIDPSAKARIAAWVREAGLSSSHGKGHSVHGAAAGISAR